MAAVAAAASSVARAQDEEVSTQLWADYNQRWTWPSSFEIYGDVGARTELRSQGWGRIILRPGVRGTVGAFRLSGGIGSFYTANQDAPNGWEIRPFQGIAATWPSARVRLDHYLRLEERFEFETADWTLEASLRLRYRLQIQFLWGGIRGAAFWRLIGHAEGFATLTGEAGQFDEKLRIGVGIERGFGPALRLRVDATWQKTGLNLFNAPTDDLYIRVRLFHMFKVGGG
jgi:hypothetical protein